MAGFNNKRDSKPITVVAIRPAAREVERGAGGQELVGAHGCEHLELLVQVHGNVGFFNVHAEQRGRIAANDHPGDGRVDFLAIEPFGHDLQAVGSRGRVVNEQPFDVVLLRERGVLAAGFLCAVRALVHPQVEVVEHGFGERVGRLLVPGHDDVEAACSFRDGDVHILVVAAGGFGSGTAVHPAVLRVAGEDTGARGNEAHSVLVLECAGAVRVVAREVVRAFKKGIGSDCAGHEPSTGEGRSFTEAGLRFHEQRGHTGHGGRCHARTA